MSKVINRSLTNFIKYVTKKGGFRTKDLERASVVLNKAIDPCCQEVTFIFDTATTPTTHKFIVKNQAGSTIFETTATGGNIQTGQFSNGLFTVCIEVITTVGAFLTVIDGNGGDVITHADDPGVYCATLSILTPSYTASTSGS